MVLKVEHCTDADMDRTFAIISSAFANDHPYINAAFPKHSTPEGRGLGGERMLAIKRSDPNTTFLKVTDTDTGEMIAQAKWNIYDGVVPEEADIDGPFWETEDDKEYAQILCREYLIPRRRAIRDAGGKLVSLDILTVDPAKQRGGAGRLLVKWGTDVADTMGVEAVVEATVPGRGLYASEGFKEQFFHETKLPAKFAGRGTQSFTWMVRPARKV